MITLDSGLSRFNFRIGGIALRGDQVLLHHGADEDFWTIPGGRCEMGETSAQALEREMREELGAEVRAERLLWVVENFFEYGGKSAHELGLYYLMTFPEDSPVMTARAPFTIVEGNLTLIFDWHPIEGLSNVIIKPSFLSAALAAIPESTGHIVHHDRTGR